MHALTPKVAPLDPRPAPHPGGSWVERDEGFPSSRCASVAGRGLARGGAVAFAVLRTLTVLLSVLGLQCINLQLHKFLYNIPAMMI